MANLNGGQQLGLDQGKGVSSTDKTGMFLKVFAGEVLTAFTRTTKTMTRHIVRTISSGKAAQFPVLGRTSAAYLYTGESLDDKRKGIKHTEKTIAIDGLLTTDVVIYDIEDAMNHYDVRAEYTKQLGEALAIAADGAVLGEMVKLCNLPDNANENITGLGKPTVLTIAQIADQAAKGKELIKSLTKARAALTNNQVPASDRYFYTTPDNYSAILAALMPNEANYAALIDPETGNIKNVMGFEVIEVPHLVIGGAGDNRVDDGEVPTNQRHSIPETTGGDIKVAKSNLEGIIQHRTAVGTVKLKDLSLERARRAEYQGDEIIARYAMGHGGLRPESVGAIISGTVSTKKS